MKLLQELLSIRGASSDESRIKDYILTYIEENKKNWKVEPKIFHDNEFQDNIILVFGKPKVAIFAHTDTIGFSTAYDKTLYKIGGPRTQDGFELVGSDSQGEIETELMIIEDQNGNQHLNYISEREYDRATILTFKPNFRETDLYIQSPYMDNRLGVWNALKVAETLENGAIVFSTYEEHGGNSVGFCGRFLFEKYGLRQALISDITWVTEGVVHGGGVAISMRDSGLPRRTYLNKILDLAKKSGIKYQLEVEASGGSDGTMLQKTDVPFDWVFIGAPEDNVHSPDEKVYKYDIMCMVEMYKYLMANLD
ncbi:MAG: aminopeptidase [Bacteroidota bacterium]